MRRILIILLIFCGALCCYAGRPSGDLAQLLNECLRREQITPDSVYYNIAVLERYREQQTEPGARAIVTAALARMYSERAYLAQTESRETASHPDSLKQWTSQEWQQRSLNLFCEALQDLNVLHFEQTKDWLPLVSRGKDENVFGRSMLYVVWHSMHISLPWYMTEKEPLLSLQRLSDYYKSRGLDDAVVWLECEQKENFPPKNNPMMAGFMGKDIYPGKPIDVELRLKNMQEASLRIYAINDTLGMDDADFCRKVLKTGKLVRDIRHILKEKADTILWMDTVRVEGLPQGHYAMIMDGKTKARLAKKPELAETEFWVKRQKLFGLSMPDGKMRLWKVDAMSGAPMDTLEWDTVGTSNYFQYAGVDSVTKRVVKIYTDRPIYRPGQTVHIGGVSFSCKVWEAEVDENRAVTIKILDADRKKISEETVYTDDFGVFDYDFVIPESCKLGSFRVSVANTTRSFRVEEYKRPEFFITMDEAADGSSLQPGVQKEITISGQLIRYNGAPLSGARITATAERGYCWKLSDKKTFVLDTLQTDFEGRFSYTVKVDTTFSDEWRRYSRLNVCINALSPTGETLSARSSYRLFVDPPQPVVENPWAKKIDGEVYLYHTLITGRDVLTDTMFIMKDTLFLPEIPYEERFGQRAIVSFMYAKDGNFYRKEYYVDKPLPKDTLQYRWETFRDKVQPGAHENWTLTITKKDGTPVRANVMATLYDASLNALSSLSWKMSVPRAHATPYMTVAEWGDFNDGRYQYLSYMMQPWYTKVRDKSFSYFNETYFLPRYERYHDGIMYLSNVKVRGKSAATGNAKVSTMAFSNGIIAGTQEQAVAEEEPSVQMREDFSESAFFLPKLRTDENGKVVLSFTMPESLTTWNLKFLAHTKQLESIVGEENIIAQKKLMTQLHLPRYLRQEDKVWVTASVVNISETKSSGNATFVVKDVHSGTILVKKQVTFDLDSKTDTIYRFQVEAGKSEELMCQFVASSKECSDGEQRMLNVVSPWEKLISSTALTLKPGEKKEIKLEELFPAGAINKKVIVEKTVNPIWVALDALPHMSLPVTDNAISLTQTYFAESLIKMMPALMPAADTLFKNRQVHYSREFCISKIAAMQRADGSFSWYKGMGPSEWVTGSVVKILARLRMLENGKNHDEAAFQADIIYSKAEQWLKDKKITVFEKPTRQVADSIIELLPHADGYYLASPGGWKTSVDERVMRNVEALEIIERIYPEKTELAHAIRSWILNQKRTEGWNNPMACVEAVYALLKNGDFTDLEYQRPFERDTVVAWGYPIAFQNDGRLDMWAAVYAQYELPVDKVQETSTGLRVERSSRYGEQKIGEELPIRVVITADRNYEYVHLTIPRSAAVESKVKLSGYGYKDGLSFYREIREQSTEYYIESLPQGTYVLEDNQIVEREGEVSSGIAKIECLYAPEFRAHTTDEKLKLER